jgi:hypothetical protein
MKLSHKAKHHIAVSFAVGLVALAQHWLPAEWQFMVPWIGFGGSLLWIWSE